MHELVFDFGAFVSLQEVKVATSSAVLAEFPSGAIYLFMTQVVA